ncbi:MAG: hypothetical protein GFH27_549285n322 [Chloroflexi bacterium AL-W]|nr:hypothetical protein [Chloroflexi bacterium AL-N1]NOK65833.1 hypothetical protein [Chloroflexi bacterium AL-N10]NOK74226.1 hypothetical protein [Chloroflexi bacterium AL-N5]NOK80866.1 hypothetical protein [Chloroflexi bacterium AL-W]NOK88484.1 hypothetical protein [Chloroflexi bacterium AL-N15]
MFKALLHYTYTLSVLLIVTTTLGACTQDSSTKLDEMAAAVEPTAVGVTPLASNSSTGAAATISTLPQATSDTEARPHEPSNADISVVAPADDLPQNNGALPSAANLAVERAMDDLAEQEDVPRASIEVLSVQPQFKPTDTSDSPGETSGWVIRLAVGDAVFRYRSDTAGNVHQLSSRN